MPIGHITLRLPADLHAVLSAESTAQNVSLNTLMVALLAGGIGFKLENA